MRSAVLVVLLLAGAAGCAEVERPSVRAVDATARPFGAEWPPLENATLEEFAAARPTALLVKVTFDAAPTDLRELRAWLGDAPLDVTWRNSTSGPPGFAESAREIVLTIHEPWTTLDAERARHVGTERVAFAGQTLAIDAPRNLTLRLAGAMREGDWSPFAATLRVDEPPASTPKLDAYREVNGTVVGVVVPHPAGFFHLLEDDAAFGWAAEGEFLGVGRTVRATSPTGEIGALHALMRTGWGASVMRVPIHQG